MPAHPLRPIARPRKALLLGLISLLLVGAPHPARADGDEPSCGLTASRVQVLTADEGLPVVEAVVTVQSSATTARGTAPAVSSRTDNTGFVCVTMGPGAVTVRALGFRPLERQMTSDGDVVIRLERLPARLGGLQTSAARRGSLNTLELAPTALSVTADERRAMPSLVGVDPLRSVATQPGVVTRNDLSAGMSVRGGAPDQTRVLFDGFPVLQPFHLGGVVGAMSDAVVGKVTLLADGLPASYGGSLAGVLDVGAVDDSVPGWRRRWTTSMVATGGSAVGRLRDGDVTVAAAARMSYIGALANRVSPGSFPYGFSDAQLHGRVKLPAGGTLALTATTSSDAFDWAESDSAITSTSPASQSTGFRWTSRMAGVRWTQPAGAFEFTQRVSRATFDGDIHMRGDALAMTGSVDAPQASSAVQWTGSRITASAGAGISGARVDYAATQRSSGMADQQQWVRETNEWIDVVSRLTPSLMVRTGLRFERVPGASWSGASPRGTVEYRASEGVQLFASAARTAQWLFSASPDGAALQPVELWMASGPSTPVARGLDVSAGLRSEGEGRALRVSVWRRSADNVPERLPAIDPLATSVSAHSALSKSVGADVAVERTIRSARFSIGYTLSRSVMERGGEQWFTAQDRRHVLNATFVREFGVTSLSIASNWSSGAPYTDQIGVYQADFLDPVSGSISPGPQHPIVGDRAALRLPAYSRTDLRVARRTHWGHALVEPSISLLNVLNRTNVLQYEWDYTTAPAQRVSRSQLPFLPSIGLDVSF